MPTQAPASVRPPASAPAAAGAGTGVAPWRRHNRRLAFALLFSLLAHGLLFAVHFRMPDPPKRPDRDRGLEVVLVNARHLTPPERADVLAQANMDGGGTVEHDARPTSPLPPQAAQRDGDALVNARRRAESVQAPRQQTLTAPAAPAPEVRSTPAQENPRPAPPQVSGLDLLDSAAAMARLEAQIERDLQEYSRRPRRMSIGARAREYRFAQYVEDWRQKVERVGTLNYPDAARGKLYGSLMMTVTLRADGSVESVAVVRSSGHPVLDEAAQRIIRMAAPFAPFPPDIRQDIDLLEITRTWTFTNADQMRSN
ncbi:energy transducer TonB [Pseudothauera nasutitermitis]|uniref:Energy transducer TonB n=1 Tax=Pseudothauera nasutitermitis TaxID=2565930 RepID=A0A4S4AQF3_9RHOO|nr:TonB family protein [Pseudothauera nasutitermitis]THF61950.1 energy transducer TonB [Pseudothauera nasutitermitis]